MMDGVFICSYLYAIVSLLVKFVMGGVVEEMSTVWWGGEWVKARTQSRGSCAFNRMMNKGLHHPIHSIYLPEGKVIQENDGHVLFKDSIALFRGQVVGQLEERRGGDPECFKPLRVHQALM